MHLALVGADAQTLSLAAAAKACGHRLLRAYDVGRSIEPLRAIDPQIVVSDQWESLLLEGLVQAVIVAPDERDEGAERFRKLAAAGVPLLLSHPISSSSLLHYELEMIRRDTGGVLLPYIASRWSPAVASVAELISTGKLGNVEQVVFERSLPDRRRPNVLAQFAIDVDLLRQLGGELTRLGAMGTVVDGSYGSLGVQLSGPSGILVRWSCELAQAVPCGRVVVTGLAGRATLTMPHDGSWQVEWTGEPGLPRSFDSARATRLAIEALAAAVERPATSASPGWHAQSMDAMGVCSPPDWSDAIRAVELAETIDRSLKKGRVIELRQDEETEESAFKGTMAAAGCALLLLGLLLLVIVSAAGGLGLKLAEYWTWGLLFILVLFLGLQFLRFLVPQREQRQ
jgi:predicted dehydrogenase